MAFLNFNNGPAAPTAPGGMFNGLYTDENIVSLLKRMQTKGKVDGDALKDGVPNDALKAFFSKASDAPLSNKPISVDGLPDNTGLRTTASLAGNWIADNKLKTAGLGLAGAANLAGLFDNDKIVGQLLGGAGGFAAGKLLPGVLKANPLTGSGLALATMGGGYLGSLFDKLMAKKAEEEAAIQAQYAGMY